MVRLLRCILLTTWLFALMAGFVASSVQAAALITHAGYLTDIQSEKQEHYYEIFLMYEPKPATDKSLTDKIFTADLVKEFHQRYDEKFGRSETERTYYHPNQFSYVDTSAGTIRTIQQQTDDQRAFGEYMTRRLVEFHVDNYAKNEPSVRPMWELKEKYSKVQVKVAQGYNFDINYSLSGNFLDLKLKNPYNADARLSIQMDPSAFGPSSVQETKAILGYQVTPKSYVEANYAVTDGIDTLIFRRKLRPNLEGSLLGSTFTHLGGTSKRETRELVALAWVY